MHYTKSTLLIWVQYVKRYTEDHQEPSEQRHVICHVNVVEKCLGYCWLILVYLSNYCKVLCGPIVNNPNCKGFSILLSTLDKFNAQAISLPVCCEVLNSD